MMREISIHQNDKVSWTFREAINISAAKTHLAWARMQHNFVLVNLLEFTNNVLCAIGRVVVNNNYFHVDIAKVDLKFAILTFPQMFA